ncbi:hypothetical protein QCA50_006228 [Cerrena zonata]|uniref:F-box domain-containing protein n=1 Tax=Cerrena zonata TaxID=2478898 RepID=A0AAW0GCT1_9APHY
MPRRLPPELVDQAINWIYLDSDRWDSHSKRTKLIREPALVCKEWAAICRPYIFREIRINKRRANQFLALLQTAPAIGLVVKRLMFDGRDRHRKRGSLSWLVSAFTSFHNYLPNINDFCINYARIPRSEDAVDWTTSLYPLLETMASVRTLVIEDTGASPDIVQELSCAFPNLDCVMLSECYFMSEFDEDSETTYDHPPTFRQLCVDWYGSHYSAVTDDPNAWASGSLDTLAPFLLTAEPNRSLRSLKLNICREHLRSVVSLIDQLGPRLEELALDVKINENVHDEHPGPITLKSNTNLQHLTLAVPKLQKNYCEWTNTISSTHLRRLEYHVIFHDTDFTALASELTRPNFAGLDELTFVCLTVSNDPHPEGPDTKLRSNVEKYIPKFVNRHGHDVLRFKHDEWYYSGGPYDVFYMAERHFSYDDEQWDSWSGGDDEEVDTRRSYLSYYLPPDEINEE